MGMHLRADEEAKIEHTWDCKCGCRGVAKIVHAADCRCRDCKAGGKEVSAAGPRGDFMEKWNEETFQNEVIDLAHRHGWRVAHFRAVRITRADGSTYYATPVQADGDGFPDLILVGHGRIIAWELKVKPNKPSADQLEWIASFKAAGAYDAAVRYPSDWSSIVEVLTRRVTP
jgi:hypothetical protein